MSRKLTPHRTLGSLKKEAKRWLQALRAGDAVATARFRHALPDAPAQPGLRDVQHALAREHGLDGWNALSDQVRRLQANPEDTNPEAPLKTLLDAAGRGDRARVLQVITEHPEIINSRGGAGTRTALLVAVGSLQVPVVECLLEHGADPNIRDDGDAAMPLHFAAEKEHLGIIRLLVEHGADPVGAGDYHELEVIGWATCFGKGQPEIVEYLTAHGARHNLFSAVATGAVDEIRRLATAPGVDLNRRMDLANYRRRPLHLAVVKKQAGSLAALLELGADPEALDEAWMTALDQAALNGETALADLLLRHGARLQLPAAIGLGREPEVQRLLREDPGCLRPGNRWGYLIIRAAESSSGPVVERLIAAGAEVNTWDDPKTAIDSTARYTPLHGAAWFGNAESAAVLLRHGADPTVREERYVGTPASWANHAGHAEVRDLILTGPIDLFDAIQFNCIDRIPEILRRDPAALDRPFKAYATVRSRPDQWWPEPWWTPLAFAVLRDKVEAAQALLASGANRDLKEPGGGRLSDLASSDAMRRQLKQPEGS